MEAADGGPGAGHEHGDGGGALVERPPQLGEATPPEGRLEEEKPPPPSHRTVCGRTGSRGLDGADPGGGPDDRVVEEALEEEDPHPQVVAQQTRKVDPARRHERCDAIAPQPRLEQASARGAPPALGVGDPPGDRADLELDVGAAGATQLDATEDAVRGDARRDRRPVEGAEGTGPEETRGDDPVAEASEGLAPRLDGRDPLGPRVRTPSHRVPERRVLLLRTISRRGPLRCVPPHRGPVHRVPLHRGPIYRVPLRRCPIYRVPLHRVPLHRGPIYRVPLHLGPPHRVAFRPGLSHRVGAEGVGRAVG